MNRCNNGLWTASGKQAVTNGGNGLNCHVSSQHWPMRYYHYYKPNSLDKRGYGLAMGWVSLPRPLPRPKPPGVNFLVAISTLIWWPWKSLPGRDKYINITATASAQWHLRIWKSDLLLIWNWDFSGSFVLSNLSNEWSYEDAVRSPPAIVGRHVHRVPANTLLYYWLTIEPADGRLSCIDVIIGDGGFPLWTPSHLVLVDPNLGATWLLVCLQETHTHTHTRIKFLPLGMTIHHKISGENISTQALPTGLKTTI